jgi:hypothetical protein
MRFCLLCGIAVIVLPYLIKLPNTILYELLIVFLLGAPISLLYTTLLQDWKEERLSLLQFVREIALDSPNYFRLRKGLKGVERRLVDFGLSVPTASLFLGASYTLLNGRSLAEECSLLGDWMVEPKINPRITSIISDFLAQEKEAISKGFKRAPRIGDRLSHADWQNINYAVIAITTTLATVIGVIALIRTLTSPH